MLPYLHQVDGNRSTCSYATATTSPYSVSVHLLHVVVTHWLHQHVHCKMLSSEESTCPVKIWTLGPILKDVIVMLLWSVSLHALSVLCENVFVHQHYILEVKTSLEMNSTEVLNPRCVYKHMHAEIIERVYTIELCITGSIRLYGRLLGKRRRLKRSLLPYMTSNLPSKSVRNVTAQVTKWHHNF